MRNVRSVLEHGVRIDSRAEQKYRAFQNYWTRVRVDAGIRVSELFERAEKTQAEFDARYERAESHFHRMQSQSTLELHTVPFQFFRFFLSSHLIFRIYAF
jgi:hypothetical protein